jgi:uncharacterized membrane protein
MAQSLYQKWDYLNRYNQWIAWNLFLAFIPLVISFYLFRKPSTQRSPLWWVGLAVYIAFLPNAPYVLTDIIHLIEATWATPSLWKVTFFYIPIHLGAIFLAFEAYVVSLINQSFYLRRIGLKQYIFRAELLTHILCAVGIYLGRFVRLNSWDIVTAPKNVALVTLNELTGKGPLAVMVVTAIILAILYWLMKQVTIGILLRIREWRNDSHHFD